MALIVQKFGGSSVANAERVMNVARIVTDTYKQGNDVIVVVSAQGDTTDDLIDKAKEISEKPSKREMDMLLCAGEQISIEDAVKTAKPKYLLITLGVNGIAFMDEEWFIRDYTALVEMVRAASPDTKIILNSIYPVAASYQYLKDINNDRIRAANGWIERIAETTGTRFLNSYECLVGPDGFLPEESQNGDGLHLTGEAFGKVMEYIRTHAYVE